ncbi:TetR/AcrR family transcriptional regulator [Streptomyces olivochromogenes]|uniref:TetR/AcrR family transcriptional regulator n=1 Tax=Streptomyces olivochromogenes TaxID=1963 RepID=UPI001F24D976|nr:TetR/AcrR family transcriptional regulator [Streptomyces olivochromogenes]MCF3131939.1 TetR/AcrR family transcriptional regulator [Streptomyces olivochromogenes]
MDVEQGRRRLTADDWAPAALDAIGEGGLNALAVEPIAARLGTTKGSFYWHFANRDALVVAALELWERRFTEATITALAAEPDPAARLRMLFTQVSGSAGQNAAGVNLLAAAAHELVAPVVRRVVQRRIDFTIGIFEEIGFPLAVAVRRAMLGYAAYVGHYELATRLPGVLPLDDGGQLADYVDSVLELLLHDAPTRWPPSGGRLPAAH